MDGRDASESRQRPVTGPRIAPLAPTSVGRQGVQRKDLLRLVRFLYMIRWPHSRQRIGSRDLISFVAPQSLNGFREAKVRGRVRTGAVVLHGFFGSHQTGPIAPCLGGIALLRLLAHGKKMRSRVQIHSPSGSKFCHLRLIWDRAVPRAPWQGTVSRRFYKGDSKTGPPSVLADRGSVYRPVRCSIPHLDTLFSPSGI